MVLCSVSDRGLSKRLEVLCGHHLVEVNGVRANARELKAGESDNLVTGGG